MYHWVDERAREWHESSSYTNESYRSTMGSFYSDDVGAMVALLLASLCVPTAWLYTIRKVTVRAQSRGLLRDAFGFVYQGGFRTRVFLCLSCALWVASVGLAGVAVVGAGGKILQDAAEAAAQQQQQLQQQQQSSHHHDAIGALSAFSGLLSFAFMVNSILVFEVRGGNGSSHGGVSSVGAKGDTDRGKDMDKDDRCKEEASTRLLSRPRPHSETDVSSPTSTYDVSKLPMLASTASSTIAVFEGLVFSVLGFVLARLGGQYPAGSVHGVVYRACAVRWYRRLLSLLVFLFLVVFLVLVFLSPALSSFAHSHLACAIECMQSAGGIVFCVKYGDLRSRWVVEARAAGEWGYRAGESAAERAGGGCGGGVRA